LAIGANWRPIGRLDWIGNWPDEPDFFGLDWQLVGRPKIICPIGPPCINEYQILMGRKSEMIFGVFLALASLGQAHPHMMTGSGDHFGLLGNENVEVNNIR
jgi:hypothetical protein